MAAPSLLLEAVAIGKRFERVTALTGVSLSVAAGEIHCLLGDNGAGKSTLVGILSGLYRPTRGKLLFEGRAVSFSSPRDARRRGIATVYQDLALLPLLSIRRNFFLGREPLRPWPSRRWGPLRLMDFPLADAVTRQEMARIGIAVRDARQAVGTLSGGERQILAIARAVYFGARVLILDEPTSALGVRQTDLVLDYLRTLQRQGLAVILVTHNAHHAHRLGDRFTILRRGRSLGSFGRAELGLAKLQALMGGGKLPPTPA